MARPLLMITKPPQFNEEDEVVVGQCDPETPGWQLFLVQGDSRELLAEGVYRDLRRIQKTCAGLQDAGELRERVEQLEAEIAAAGERPAPTESTAQEVTRTLDVEKFRDQLERRRAKEREDAKDESAVLISLEMYGTVCVAAIEDAALVRDVPLFGRALDRMLAEESAAVILDLAVVKQVSSRAIHELVRFHERCRQQERRLILVGLSEEATRMLRLMNLDQLFDILPSAADALQALGLGQTSPEAVAERTPTTEDAPEATPPR